MKLVKTFFLILCLAAVAAVNAQAPQSINSQAVLRDAAGRLIANQPVGVRITIAQGSPTGTAAYVETHAVTTNDNGLYTITIGAGTPATGTFAAIDWGNGPYFITTDIDPAGSSNYTITTSQQFLSVPYALFADTAARVAQAATSITAIYADTSNIAIYANGSRYSVYADTAMYYQERQVLTCGHDTIYLTGGSYVVLPNSADTHYVDSLFLTVNDKINTIRNEMHDTITSIQHRITHIINSETDTVYVVNNGHDTIFKHTYDTLHTYHNDTVRIHYYDTVTVVNNSHTYDTLHRYHYDTVQQSTINHTYDTLHTYHNDTVRVYHYDTLHRYHQDTVRTHHYDTVTIVNNNHTYDTLHTYHSDTVHSVLVNHIYDTVHTYHQDTVRTHHYDTVRINKFDTIRINKYDTVRINKYDTVHRYHRDTVYVHKYDTVRINKFDTVRITQYDTLRTHDTVVVHSYDTIHYSDAIISTLTNRIDSLNQVVKKNNKYDTIEGTIMFNFSVSPTNKVRFSKGNLQYQASTNTWRFAEHQFDIIGENNSNISSTYSGWIDLFGWGTSGYHDPSDVCNTQNTPWATSNVRLEDDGCASCNYYGYGPSTNWMDSNLIDESRNYDWGWFNSISNGGDCPKIWRILSLKEMEYILLTRNTKTYCNGKLYTDIRFFRANVGSINGLVIVPDYFRFPQSINLPYRYNDYGINVYFSYNSYTIDQWMEMENAGAVFLPCGGHRVVNSVLSANESGFYWFSDCNINSHASWLASYFEISQSGIYIRGSGAERYFGHNIRLVQNVE